MVRLLIYKKVTVPMIIGNKMKFDNFSLLINYLVTMIIRITSAGNKLITNYDVLSFNSKFGNSLSCCVADIFYPLFHEINAKPSSQVLSTLPEIQLSNKFVNLMMHISVEKLLCLLYIILK